MNILAIETSCDETAAAVVQNGRKIISSVVHSQIGIHRKYAGVVPELASRSHVHFMQDVIAKAFSDKKHPIEAVAVTVGPGLAGSLLIGRMAAETLGWLKGLPVIGVNHIEGHLLSGIVSNHNFIPPFLGLVVSGGHTELIYSPRWGVFERLGRTRDDAAGEAFDKVAKMLDLGYPGGPNIDRWAREGTKRMIPFPIPWLDGSWDFSFSGLKTAVLYKLREKKKWSLNERKRICAGFQHSVVTVLVKKTIQAARALKCRSIVVGGGVAANSSLREEFKRRGVKEGFQIYMPPIPLCTDNAAMIAAAAHIKWTFHKKGFGGPLHIQPHLSIPPMTRSIHSFNLP